MSSSLAGGAKNDRCKPFFDGLQRFFVIVSLERFCRSAGTILYIFRCMPANWLRTFFPGLLMKIGDLLIRFFRTIFRMGPTPAMRPVCWPVPATCGAVPPGPPSPATRSPAPSALGCQIQTSAACPAAPTVEVKMVPVPAYRELRTPSAASLLTAEEMKARKVCQLRPKIRVTGSIAAPIL